MQQYEYFTKTKPKIDNKCDPPGVYLIFDCVPSQYRKVCEWIVTKWNRTSVLYRYVIPCHRMRYDLTELSSYELHFPQDLLRTFTGYFDYWPENSRFEVCPITIDIDIATSPLPSPPLLRDKHPLAYKSCLSGFYRDGYLGEHKYLLPEFSSGLSFIEQRAVQLVEEAKLTSMGAVVYQLSCEFHLEVQTIEEKLLDIQRQVYPLLKRSGRYVSRTENALLTCLPYYPFRFLHPSALTKMIDTDTGTCRALYMEHPALDFFDKKTNQVVRFTSFEEYMNRWIQEYLIALCDERPKTVQFQRARADLLRRLYVQTTYEIREGNHYETRRFFVDDEPEEKVAQLQRLYAEDWLVDALLHLPIKDLGPNCVDEEEHTAKKLVMGPCWNARDEWKFQLGQYIK